MGYDYFDIAFFKLKTMMVICRLKYKLEDEVKVK